MFGAWAAAGTSTSAETITQRAATHRPARPHKPAPPAPAAATASPVQSAPETMIGGPSFSVKASPNGWTRPAEQLPEESPRRRDSQPLGDSTRACGRARRRRPNVRGWRARQSREQSMGEAREHHSPGIAQCSSNRSFCHARSWERWHERLRLLDDPPEALVASIAWESADGEVTGVKCLGDATGHCRVLHGASWAVGGGRGRANQ